MSAERPTGAEQPPDADHPSHQPSSQLRSSELAPAEPRTAPAPKGDVGSLQAELEQTRQRLSGTLDDIFATFNPGVQIRSHPMLFAGIFLAGSAAAVTAVVRLRRR